MLLQCWWNVNWCSHYGKQYGGSGYWMLGAGALGPPRGMVWGGRREEGSGWGTHICQWRIHFDIWQNQYNIVKFKNKIKKNDWGDQRTIVQKQNITLILLPVLLIFKFPRKQRSCASTVYNSHSFTMPIVIWNKMLSRFLWQRRPAAEEFVS